MRKNGRIAATACVAAVCALFISCRNKKPEQAEMPEDIRQHLIDGVASLGKSENLYVTDGLSITGLGEIWGVHPQKTDGCYYWPAIQKMTNISLDMKWYKKDVYPSIIAATLLMNKEELPDIVEPDAFGIMDLAQNGTIVALDAYLPLMPNIVAAVGKDRMDSWRQADGHIYTFPSITNVQGAMTMMVRRDWLDKLGLEVPQTWEEWLTLWRAIRDTDMNGNGDPHDEIPLMLEQGTTGERSMIALLNAFGIQANNDCTFCVLSDGTYTLITEHPRYNEFLETARSLYAEGIIDAAYTTRINEQMDKIMNQNRVATTFTWAEFCRTSTEELHKQGIKEALWEAVPPITGPHGDCLLPERKMVSNIWSITAAADERGKTEDIVRFFDWCFSEEGRDLYCFGIPGYSYDILSGRKILRPEYVADGFTSYRSAGLQFEPFGGFFQEEAYLQCLFKGKQLQELDEPSQQFYRGLAEVNGGCYYRSPMSLGTEPYVRHHTRLITHGICAERDKTIQGKQTVQEFWEKYRKFKEEGLQDVIDAGAKTYRRMTTAK